MAIYKRILITTKAAILLAAFSYVLPSHAQLEFSCAGMPYLDVKERRIKAMDADLAKKLDHPRYLISPYPPEDNPNAVLPEPDPATAIRELDGIRTDRLESHEKAEIYYLYAYANYLNDNAPQALDYYKRTVAEEGANGPMVERTLQTIARLNMLQEDYQQGLNYYLNWACVKGTIGSREYAEISYIYSQLDNLDEALRYIEKAISIEEGLGKIGQENWYTMQYQFYYQKENIPAAIAVVKKLVVYYPDVKYWRTLGGMFSEMEDSKSQLAAYHLAYLQNGLDNENQLKGLGYMMIAAGAPYQGAEIMVKGIDKKIIEESEDVMRSIGYAYYQARELDKALPWMERAAQAGEKGESYSGLSAIYLSLLRYDDAIRTGKEALRLGGLNRPDQVQLNIGSAQAALNKYDDAVKTFESITDSRSRKSAQDFIVYVTGLKEREAQIRASGIDLDALRRN